MFGPAVIVVIGTLAAIIVIGQLARARLRRRYPPTGRFVDVGGYRLHLQVRGSGPVVVLEAGAMAPGAAWSAVVPELSSLARVVTYDRAGLGWSDPSPRPRTPVVMADELHTLLERSGLPGPYILVGHSLGGTIVRVFAHEHPQEVAGVVLLDGAHEDQFERAPAALRTFTTAMARRMPAMFAVLRVLVRAGVLALRPSMVPAAMGPLPADALAAIRATVAMDPRVLTAMGRELADLEAGNAEVRAMGIRSLGDVPLVVVSHGRPEATPPQLGPEVAAANEALWQELQAAQATLSPRGRRIVADGIGHDIPTAAPGLVVEVIRETIAAAGIAPATEAAA